MSRAGRRATRPTQRNLGANNFRHRPFFLFVQNLFADNFKIATIFFRPEQHLVSKSPAHVKKVNFYRLSGIFLKSLESFLCLCEASFNETGEAMRVLFIKYSFKRLREKFFIFPKSLLLQSTAPRNKEDKNFHHRREGRKNSSFSFSKYFHFQASNEKR